MKKILKPLVMGVIMALTTVAVQAADYTIRATANSNENDEDYDGLVVFKNYVESASNGAIAVELFIGHSSAQKALNACKASLMAQSMFIFPRPAVQQEFSHMCRFSTCLI